ncbi:hypothetical protein GQ43DRAFT_439422 [Delitschia confertaspora ATCC 74209]|uniref:C2H2-type domain-containing protein n=1 Tax=Delitschia confertaspora ATCC 74209 TaxID=1513339 RepID=A0A9P4JP11_9PLEO|nr:hypothetical protein GQ43DRAFT_439422 [Delitschia confertaspora ATCC 74209]
MAAPQRKPTSIYSTIKVFQVIDQLRRRLKPRLHPDPSKRSLLGPKSPLGLEEIVVQNIEKTVSRMSDLRGKKQSHPFSNRIRKSHRNGKYSSRRQTPERHDSASPDDFGGELQHVVKSADENFSHSDSVLSAVASDDKLFLKQNLDPHFDAYPLNDISKYWLLVCDALDVFYRARSQYDDEWLINQGQAIGLNFDAEFIANYEHILLRLQAMLMSALTRKLIEALSEGGQDKKRHKLLDWFAEFPNSCRPLSTTWPWSIKPSLAVLWGVCWMFYENHQQDGGQATNGNGRISQNRMLQAIQIHQNHWNSAQRNDYYNNGQELIHPLLQPQPQQQISGNAGNGIDDVSSSSTAFSEWVQSAPDFTSNHVIGPRTGRQDAQPHSPSFGQRNLASLAHADRHPVYRSLAIPCSTNSLTTTPTSPTALQQRYNTHASPALHALPRRQDAAAFAPHLSSIATASQIFPPHAQPGTDHSWLFNHQEQQQHSSALASALPPGRNYRSTSHLTLPDIKVTAGDEQSPENECFAPPQQDFFSSNISPYLQHPQASQHSLTNTGIRTDDISDFAHYTMGNCPPEHSPIHQSARERTPSHSSNIPTPMSMSDNPLSPLTSPNEDDRGPSSIASILDHQREESVSSQDNGSSLHRNRAFKRTEEPPRTRENKMTCKYPECFSRITFERKCEWSKHMDKHDRPYKCKVKGCEKLQGFTYSGGLLRHEREVHKLHGGTKQSLFCPHSDCKRSSGSGFTRKENLLEHIRRVHRRISVSSDLGSNTVNARPREALEARESRETQQEGSQIHRGPEEYRRSETQEEDTHGKRKRIEFEEDIEEETDLRKEVKRLRIEAAEKDKRLQRLEETVRRMYENQ